MFSLAKELLELEEFRALLCWIEEYTIKDLDNDGKLEIIATLSEPCTSCPVQLLIIKNREDRFVLFNLDTVHALINDVVDLDSDGIFEVIIPHWQGEKPAKQA